MNFLIKKNDKVIVLSGKDKGKTGTVKHVYAKKGTILVSGVNIVKKHVKVSKKYPSGGTVEVTKPMLVGKVQLICPSCNKPTRAAIEKKGNEKSRKCKKCGKIIITPKEVKEK